MYRYLRLAVLCVLGNVSPEAFADDYGCKVLLCLANPAGPTAVSQCVPPITQLWRDLARGHAFPSCDEALPAYAVPGNSPFDPCPEGTTTLAEGLYAVLDPNATPWRGIGEGEAAGGGGDGGGLSGPSGAKICVGNKIGPDLAFSYGGGGGDGGDSTILVGRYDRVVLLDAAASPRTIDVYLNGLLYRRVRW